MNLFDCHGGPGTTEPACGACVTCLHRVIEEKDARIQRLEEAFSYAVNGASAAFDAAGIPPGEFVDRANAVTTRIKRLLELGDAMAFGEGEFVKYAHAWIDAKGAKP